MAIGDPYANALDLEHRVGSQNSMMFDAVLDAASRAVESFTGRQFNKTETASPRRFGAVTSSRLVVDDFHTTDDLVVEVGGDVWPLDRVDLHPWDGVVNGVPGWPYYELHTLGRSWPRRRRTSIVITAQWGWADVPEAIRQATLDVAAVMSFGVGTGAGPVRSEAIDGYSVSYKTPELDGGDHVPPELAKAAPYRRRRFGIA